MGDNCQYQISNLFAWQCHPKLCGLDCYWCDRNSRLTGWIAFFLRHLTILHKIVFQYLRVQDQETIGKAKMTTFVKCLLAWTWSVERFPAQCSHVKCSVTFPFQSYHCRREHTAGIPCSRRKKLENLVFHVTLTSVHSYRCDSHCLARLFENLPAPPKHYGVFDVLPIRKVFAKAKNLRSL